MKIIFLMIWLMCLCGCSEDLPMTELYWKVHNQKGSKLKSPEYYWLGNTLIKVTHKSGTLWLFKDNLGGRILNAIPERKEYKLSNGDYVGLLPYGNMYRSFPSLKKSNIPYIRGD
jgi:hypothetical protein